MREPTFVGVGLARESSELIPPTGPPVQPAYLRRLALAHEESGFDSVLVGTTSSSPDATILAAEILRATTRLGAVVTVRPDHAIPTTTAGALATLDALHPGRVAVHLPPADRTDGGERRRAEFADLLHRSWSGDRPFSHEGEFHRVARAWSAIRPAAPLPVWISGSPAASGQLGDVHLLAPESADVLVARMAAAGGHTRFGLRLRPVVAATRAAAADHAEQVLRVYRGTQTTPAAAIRSATGALHGLGPLVGTVEDVATTLLRYRELGLDVFRLAGFRPYDDARRYGAVIETVRTASTPLTTSA